MTEFEQINIFSMTMPEYEIDKPIRLIELFAGVGSQAMAMKRLGADFEHYRVVEFDTFAMQSYNAIHGTEFETTDIKNVKGEDLGIEETDKYCYLLTYSFPCTDLSLAGKQMGMTKGSGTRSGLLWEVERLLNECVNLPQVLLMENVPQVHGMKNISDFQKWIDFLASKGYTNYWQDLNAKDYGVAQNRNRCFMVSILGEYHYTFPKPILLTRNMASYLEDEVDGRYYLKCQKADKLIEQLRENGTLEKLEQKEASFNPKKGGAESQRTSQQTVLKSAVSQTASRQGMTAESVIGSQMDAELSSVNKVGFIDKGTGKHQSCEVFGSDRISPTICANSQKEPIKIVRKQ